MRLRTMDDINLDTMGLDYLFEYMNNEMYVRVEAIAATDKNSRMSIYSTDEIVESLDFEKLSEWSIRISTAFTFYGATDNSGERNLPLESTINDLMEHIQEVVTDNLYGPVGGPYVKIYTNHFIDHDTYITNRADSTSWYVAPIAISSVISRHNVSCYAMKWPISWSINDLKVLFKFGIARGLRSFLDSESAKYPLTYSELEAYSNGFGIMEKKCLDHLLSIDPNFSLDGYKTVKIKLQ